MRNKSILMAGSCVLCVSLTGCLIDPSTKPCDVVDFSIEFDSTTAPDIRKCEMFYWDCPRVEGAGVEIYEPIDLGGHGYGYEVLIGAVKDSGNRIGIMTYLMKKRQQLIKEYGLDKSRPDTYAQVASNAVVMLDIRKSPIDSQRYYFKRKETDPETYAKAESWLWLAGINRNCSFDEILLKMSFVLSSCARYYAFPDLSAIRIIPEYTYRMSFGSWYHSFAISYHPSLTEAAMRFYGFDGKMFAIIRHDVPRGAHGCSILQDVRRELVKYLFAVLPNACCERSVIKGQVRRHEGDGEWRVFVDGE